MSNLNRVFRFVVISYVFSWLWDVDAEIHVGIYVWSHLDSFHCLLLLYQEKSGDEEVYFMFGCEILLRL